MTLVKLIEYADAKPEVRAVYLGQTTRGQANVDV